MKENKQFRKLIIIIVILLIAVVFVKWFDQQRKGIEVGFPLTKLALKIDKWEGTNMGVSEKEKGWIEQGDLIVRQYKHNEDIVFHFDPESFMKILSMILKPTLKYQSPISQFRTNMAF